MCINRLTSSRKLHKARTRFKVRANEARSALHALSVPDRHPQSLVLTDRYQEAGVAVMHKECGGGSDRCSKLPRRD